MSLAPRSPSRDTVTVRNKWTVEWRNRSKEEKRGGRSARFRRGLESLLDSRRRDYPMQVAGHLELGDTTYGSTAIAFHVRSLYLGETVLASAVMARFLE